MALTVEAVAVLVIGYGALEATVKLAIRPFRDKPVRAPRKEIWLSFGLWLLARTRV